jgi:hypothetical protein
MCVEFRTQQEIDEEFRRIVSLLVVDGTGSLIIIAPLDDDDQLTCGKPCDCGAAKHADCTNPNLNEEGERVSCCCL